MTRDVDRGTSDNCTRSGLSLTSDRLSVIPKRNLHESLSIYVRDQLKFIKEYVHDQENEERHVETVSVDRKTKPCIPSTFAEESGDFVFGTPVLRARVANLLHPESEKKAEAVHKAITARDSTATKYKEPEVVPSSSKKRSLPPSHDLKDAEDVGFGIRTVQKKATKRREHIRATAKVHIDVNNEHNKRLEERRQKKRARKDTMLPTTRNSLNDDNLAESTSNQKKKNQPKSMQVGFALMHGFSATNVGKNRLTMEPFARDFGVFKKGKASTRTKVKSKKQGEQPFCFSEAKFLNKTSKKKSLVSSASSTISGSGMKSSQQSSNRVSHKKKSKVRSVNSPISDMEIQPLQRYNPEDSVVWDIEKDSEVMSKLDSHDRQGMILMKYSHGPVGATAAAKAVSEHTSDISEHSVKPSGGIDDISSPRRCLTMVTSPSVGPSQSASQLIARVPDPRRDLLYGSNPPDGPSKYFQRTEPRTSSGPRLASPNIDTAISQALIHMKPGSEFCIPIDSGYLLPPADLDSKCFGIYDPTSRPEEASFPENLIDYYHASPGPPKDRRQTYFISSSPCSGSQFGADMNLSEIDDVDLDYPFQDPMVDSLHPNLATAYHERVLPFERNATRRNFNQTSESLQAIEYRWTPIPHDLDTDSVVVLEYPHSLGGLLDSNELGISHDFSSHCHEEEENCLPDVMHVNSNEGTPKSHTFSDNNVYLIEYSNTHQPSTPDPEEGEANFDGFRQGHALLYCYNVSPKRSPNQISNVEAEVAGILRPGHWLPQRL